jgi:hypothetical protein
MDKAEPDPLPHGELERPVMVIVESFVMLLRLLQPFVNLQQELIALYHLIVHCKEPGFTRRVRAHHRQVPAVHHLERRRAHRGLEGRVITKFRPQQPLQPISRTVAKQ